MTASTGDEIRRLSAPLYSYAESDYLAGVTRGTSRRWVEGYEYRDPEGHRIIRPPITARDREHEGISFLDLIEVGAIGRLRKAGFSLKLIREVVAYCQQALNAEHPLVTLRFKHDGKEIFVERGTTLVEVGRRKGQQAWNDFLGPYLQTLDYEHDVVRRWYPLGRDQRVVVDPDYAYGLPVISGSGIRTEIVQEQFEAGESIEEIAQDFAITPDEVEQALRYESRLAKRAA